MVQQYDAVIVGAGPFGLTLATLLARWGYRVRLVDNRARPTTTGRADGIQPRSLDLLRNMGLKAKLMSHRPARMYEVGFWDPPADGSSDGIARTGSWASCPSLIDARYPFTAVLHQGFIEQLFIDDLAEHGVLLDRPWTVAGFVSDAKADSAYPVTVQLEHVDGPAYGQETVQARYLFGAEGARSPTRQRLGIRISHKDPIEHVWGVMDGVVKTDFPDIRMKCTIHSKAGSIMVIPRENNLVRLYIQLASSDVDADRHKTRATSAADMQAYAKRIMQPYHIDWERVEWHSVYPIGQGIAEHYTLDHRVFIGGDACHTHSPKAGQGMNTAFLDAQNIAWKIHLVEKGIARRDLLHTYESERKAVAEALLAFDNKYAKLFSQKPADVSAALASSGTGTATADDNAFIQTFKESCEFTSGYGVHYGPSTLVWSPAHPTAAHAVVHHELSEPSNLSNLSKPSKLSKLRPGYLLVNADATRVVDANPVHLEQEVPLNGAFRILVFAGSAATCVDAGPVDATVAVRTPAGRALVDFERALHTTNSFFAAFRRPDMADVSHHEQTLPHSLLASFCVVFAARRADIEIDRDVPGVLVRYRRHIYADDRWDVRVPDARASAHAKMGFDPDHGGVVVVRPDGYVGMVVRLLEGSSTVDALNQYFSAFCNKELGKPTARL